MVLRVIYQRCKASRYFRRPTEIAKRWRTDAPSDYGACAFLLLDLARGKCLSWKLTNDNPHRLTAKTDLVTFREV